MHNSYVIRLQTQSECLKLKFYLLTQKISIFI